MCKDCCSPCESLSHFISTVFHRTLLNPHLCHHFSTPRPTLALGSSATPSLRHPSASQPTGLLQGGLCFQRLAEQSPLAGYEPKSLVEVSSGHAPMNLLSRIGSLDPNLEDLASTADASEIHDVRDVGRLLSPLFLFRSAKEVFSLSVFLRLRHIQAWRYPRNKDDKFRAFWSEIGRTPGCPACESHTRECKTYQDARDESHRTASAAEANRGNVGDPYTRPLDPSSSSTDPNPKRSKTTSVTDNENLVDEMKCGGQDEDGVFRPILCESSENEGDWPSRPLHNHSRNTCSRLADKLIDSGQIIIAQKLLERKNDIYVMLVT